MSAISQDTFLNANTALSVVGNGGTGPSTIGAVNSVRGLTPNLYNVASTITGDVTLGLNAALSSMNSIAFAPGAGVVTGISSINGTSWPPVATVPANLQVSSISFNAPGDSASIYTAGDDATGISSLITKITGTGFSSYLKLGDTKPSAPGASALLGVNADINNPLDYVYVTPAAIEIKSTGATTITSATTLTTNSAATNIKGPTSISTLSVGALALSTIGPILNIVATPATQTINMVIGNMRIQGGSLPAAVSPGTAISWATAFSTVPLVLVSVAGAVGGSNVATVTAAGESGGTFSVNATATGEAIYWLAIGAA